MQSYEVKTECSHNKVRVKLEKSQSKVRVKSEKSQRKVRVSQSNNRVESESKSSYVRSLELSPFNTALTL